MIREAIEMLVDGQSLTMEQAAQSMEEIMEDEATPAQFGAFVTALRIARGDRRHGPGDARKIAAR